MCFTPHPANLQLRAFSPPLVSFVSVKPDADAHLVLRSLMIAGGTADTMVGDFPEQYHKLFERNQTDHIWISVPGGGHDGGVGAPLFYNFIRALFKA